MTTRDQVAAIIDAGDLGALGEEGEPIGDCLTKMWRAWSAPNRDVKIPDYLGEQLEAALTEQNAAYENGYVIDAPRAHDAKWLVCGVLDDITAVIYAASRAMTDAELRAKPKFDPHQYALDAGWDFNSVEATAEHGVAERDEEIIREMMGEQGLAGDELEDAAVDASAALLGWCKQRVAEKADDDEDDL